VTKGSGRRSRKPRDLLDGVFGRGHVSMVEVDAE
jgi:hypothetical protein